MPSPQPGFNGGGLHGEALIGTVRPPVWALWRVLYDESVYKIQLLDASGDVRFTHIVWPDGGVLFRGEMRALTPNETRFIKRFLLYALQVLQIRSNHIIELSTRYQINIESLPNAISSVSSSTIITWDVDVTTVPELPPTSVEDTSEEAPRRLSIARTRSNAIADDFRFSEAPHEEQEDDGEEQDYDDIDFEGAEPSPPPLNLGSASVWQPMNMDYTTVSGVGVFSSSGGGGVGGSGPVVPGHKLVRSNVTNLGKYPFPNWNRWSAHMSSNGTSIAIKLWHGNAQLVTHCFSRGAYIASCNSHDRFNMISTMDKRYIKRFLEYAMYYFTPSEQQQSLLNNLYPVEGLQAYMLYNMFKIENAGPNILQMQAVIDNLIPLTDVEIPPKAAESTVPLKFDSTHQEPPLQAEGSVSTVDCDPIETDLTYAGGVSYKVRALPLEQRVLYWNLQAISEHGNNRMVLCPSCGRRCGAGTGNEACKVDDEDACTRCTFACVGCNKRKATLDNEETGRLYAPGLSKYWQAPGSRNSICEECIQTKSIPYCDVCEHFTHGEMITLDQPVYGYPDVKQVCTTCKQLGMRACHQCKLYVRTGGDDGNKHLRTHPTTEKYICKGCWDIEFVHCPDCTRTGSRAKTKHPDGLCSDCVPKTFRRYHYHPDPRFLQLESEINPLHFGIEMEIEVRPSVAFGESYNPKKHHIGELGEGHLTAIQRKYASELQGALGNDFYFKSDTSLKCGIEIVSHPMSLAYINDIDLATDLQSLGKVFRAYKSSRCGMHVHLSKTAFGTDEHLANFILFHYQNKEFVRFISQRRDNHYSVLGKHTKKHLKDQSAKKASLQRDRYEAINLKPKHTVELRYFKANLLAKRFLKNLEFVQALYEFTATAKENELNLNNFIAYVNKSSFKHLSDFIEERNKLFIFEDDNEDDADKDITINDEEMPGKVNYFIQDLSPNSRDSADESLTSTAVYDLS